LLICILVLELKQVIEGLTDFYSLVRSLAWLCLAHCLAHFGSSGADDVLAVVS
jgi:hypothetical protein